MVTAERPITNLYINQLVKVIEHNRLRAHHLAGALEDLLRQCEGTGWASSDNPNKHAENAMLLRRWRRVLDDWGVEKTW